MLAEYYQDETKHTHAKLLKNAGGLDWDAKPPCFKEYPAVTAISLPEPDLSPCKIDQTADSSAVCPGFKTSTVLNPDELSAILFVAYGITSRLSLPQREYLLRAAPSAGALYPTNVYIYAHRVADLKVGLYYYDPRDHTLRQVSSDSAEISHLPETVAAGGFIEQAPLTIILTTSFYRCAWKYKERAYRYCCLDIGHVAENARLAASAFDFGSTCIARFEDGFVNRLLDLEEGEEGTMLFMPIGQIDEAASRRNEVHFQPAPTELDGKSSPLILLMHGHAYLSRADNKSFIEQQRKEIEAKVHKDGLENTVILPNSLPNDKEGLLAAVKRRRSTRNWDTASLSLAALAKRLHHARSHKGMEGCDAIDLYVIAHDVEGLPPGVYVYDDQSNLLQLTKAGEIRAATYAACLFQDVVGNAAAIAVIVVDPSRIPEADGERAYRYSAMEAGAIGERIYLSCEADDLGACGVAAFFDDEMLDILDLRDSGHFVSYLVAMGRKAKS